MRSRRSIHGVGPARARPPAGARAETRRPRCGASSPVPRAPRGPGLTLVLAALLTCCGRPAQGPGPLLEGSNLLLVTLDTTRADALGCYGGPGWSSPRLDALAAEGVRFTSARTTSPVTLPSHATILTGRRPFEHGVRDNATFRLPERAVTLAERLSDAGYATAAVVGAFVLHSDFGLAQGFDVYSDAPRLALEIDHVEDQRTAGEVVDAALELFEQGALPSPWFLWVHLFDPHAPLTPAEPFLSQALANAPPGATALERQRRLYQAEVAYADHELGRLLDQLAARRPGEEPLVMVVSDHGEALGDHGEPAHGLQVFDSTMRVPLIVQHPRLATGRVVERSVSTADLAPTLLGLLGLAAHGTSGRDLGPLLAPDAAPAVSSAAAHEPLDAEATYLETCHSLYSYGWSPLFALVAGDLKVIDGPRPAVYDLAADPGELRNLAAERPEALERARAAFRALAPLTEPGERIELEEQDARALERLGYTAGAGDPDGARTSDPLPPGRLDPQLEDPGARIETKLLCELAVNQLAAGQLQSAVETIRRVIAQDPDNPIFLSQAGTVLITAGLHDEARVALQRCLELREDPSARCSLAVALNLSGRRREAIETLRLNAELHPRHLHTRFALGELLLEMGGAAEAEEHLRAFLAEHDADDPWHAMADRLATLARGEALLQEGDLDAALDQLETFLAAHQDPDPWRQRALLLAERARAQLPD